MQSALKKVKGVKDVKVLLSDHEAVVKYDPAECTVDDLLKAVKDTKGKHSFSAKVKTD